MGQFPLLRPNAPRSSAAARGPFALAIPFLTPKRPPKEALDLSGLAEGGVHGAILKFEEKYGPVSRFTNPVNLNGAAGWTFVNDPRDVEHVCATNTKNYSDRYLPDIYE